MEQESEEASGVGLAAAFQIGLPQILFVTKCLYPLENTGTKAVL